MNRQLEATLGVVPRKIVQVLELDSQDFGYHAVVLADDGTLWRTYSDRERGGDQRRYQKWEQISIGQPPARVTT